MRKVIEEVSQPVIEKVIERVSPVVKSVPIKKEESEEEEEEEDEEKQLSEDEVSPTTNRQIDGDPNKLLYLKIFV